MDNARILRRATVGDGSVGVLPAFYVSFFDKKFEAVADGTTRRVVLLFEFDDEVGDDVATVLNHVVKNFIWFRGVARSRHSSVCCLAHLIVIHVVKNYSS